MARVIDLGEYRRERHFREFAQHHGRRDVDGLAGCVERRRRRNGSLVAVYRAEEAGLDPELPWYSSCELHNTLVGHRTRRLASHHAVMPWDWCEWCEDPDTKEDE